MTSIEVQQVIEQITNRIVEQYQPEIGLSTLTRDEVAASLEDVRRLATLVCKKVAV